MRTAVETTVQAIAFVMQIVPVGTNLGLARLLWVMVNGSFLQSRGGVFPALTLNGLNANESRRSWAALRYGSWDINALLDVWQVYVASQNEWCAHRHEQFRVLSVDVTGFWRPQLQNWTGRHFHNLVRKLLPAVVMGVMVTSGRVGAQRIPLLTRLVRSQPDWDKATFRRHLLQQAWAQAAPDQVLVVDAEFGIAELQEAHIARYVVRLSVNATARTNHLPPYKGVGTYPQYGELIRPLARTWKERLIPATAPEQTSQFTFQGRTIQVAFWQNVVTADTKVDPEAQTYSIYVYYDPLYNNPLVLATSLTVQPETPYLIYRDRWPVEQPPLAAKQMIGLHRHFVFAPETCFRLPELGFLAGAILTYVAAVLPPAPTGFWDTTPKPTPGRMRRLLAQADFPNFTQLDPQLREKDSVTDHLPKGVNAHRRHKLAA